MAAIANKENLIQELETLDSKYTEAQNELNQKIKQLKGEFAKNAQKFLEDRVKLLSPADAAKDAKGTPSLPGFWLQVLQNAEEFQGCIEEWDVPVLEYLEDIRVVNVDEDEDNGFKVELEFRENPYFENKVLSKTITTEKASDYIEQVDILEIVADEITWKNGMNVTVEVVKKKRSGGGAKKKAAAATTQPRDSFFRLFFRNLGPDHELPQEVYEDEDEEVDEEEDDERLQFYLQQDYELSTALRDYIVPHAVRWYTGEAVEGDEDDEEFDEDEEDDVDEDEDEDEEEEEQEELPKGAKGKRQEDCKQQ